MNKLIINMAVDIDEKYFVTEGVNNFHIEMLENDIKRQVYEKLEELLESIGTTTNLDVDIITEDNAEDKILEKMRKAMEGASN